MKNLLFLILVYAPASWATCEKSNELLSEQIRHFQKQDYQCWVIGSPPILASKLQKVVDGKPVHLDQIYYCEKGKNKDLKMRTLISRHYVLAKDFSEFLLETADPCGETKEVRVVKDVDDTKDYKTLGFNLRKRIPKLKSP